MRKFIHMMLGGLMALGMVAGVSAQTTDDAQIEVGVNPTGTRDVIIVQAPDFGSVPYSFNSQTVTTTTSAGNLVVVATVNTGTDEGWNVTLSGEDFIATTFPVGNMVLGAGSVAASPGTAGNVTTTPGAVQASSTEIISASEAYSSNGQYTVTFASNQLTVPGNTLVGTYTSTLTVAINSGP